MKIAIPRQPSGAAVPGALAGRALTTSAMFRCKVLPRWQGAGVQVVSRYRRFASFLAWDSIIHAQERRCSSPPLVNSAKSRSWRGDRGVKIWASEVWWARRYRRWSVLSVSGC